MTRAAMNIPAPGQGLPPGRNQALRAERVQMLCRTVRT